MANSIATMALGVALMVALLVSESAASEGTCLSNVQQYWQGLMQGNFTKALSHVTVDVSFTWPGDQRLLPMAGTSNGPAGIEAFFISVSKYFDFAFCASTPAPVLTALSTTLIYGYWNECSPLKGQTHVPCPNNFNQAQYVCDAFGLIASIYVNVDNLCVAEALCAGELSCTAS